MPKIKYDVSDVEAGQDFDTPVPVGLYTAKITEAEQRVSSSGNDMIALILVIDSGDWKGRNPWDYIVQAEAAGWKMRQFIDALGLKAKGSLDLGSLVGTRLQVKVKHDHDGEFGTRAKVGSLLAMPNGAGPADDDDAEDAADDDLAGEAEGELTFAELQEYDREQLETLIEDSELEAAYNKRTSDETLRGRVAEELGLEEESEDEDIEADDEEEAEDYAEWDVADLRAELKERSISAAGSKATLVRRLKKDDAAADDGEPF